MGGPGTARGSLSWWTGSLWLSGSRSDEVGEVVEDRALRLGADDALDRLAALEDRHGRDRHDLVVAGDLRVLVDVELGDGQLVAVLGGDLLEHRGDHLAGPAPLGPEVDEDGLVAAQHLVREARVGDRHGVACHGWFFLSFGRHRQMRRWCRWGNRRRGGSMPGTGRAPVPRPGP